MSNVQHLADEEAARNEATPDEDEQNEAAEQDEQPDGDETPGTPETPAEPEPTSEPEGPQAVSEAEYEKAMRALDKESTRHANRVSEIMGENGQALVPCPLCWTPGFVYPPEVPWLDPERIAAVKLAIGEAAEPEYREAQDKQTCDECDGLTKTLTGARAGEQIALPCRKCNGQGWIAKLTTALPGDNANTTVGAITSTAAMGTEDAWHRPPGHPHWGMAPASVGV